jgi:hypothetical protein
LGLTYLNIMYEILPSKNWNFYHSNADLGIVYLFCWLGALKLLSLLFCFLPHHYRILFL